MVSCDLIQDVSKAEPQPNVLERSFPIYDHVTNVQMLLVGR